MNTGYTILEHPADIGIEAYGSSLGEAFQNAASGLMSLILDSSTIEIAEVRKVSISALDQKQLLVKWLSEILYLYDGQQFVGRDFKISLLSGRELQATVNGEMFSIVKHKTKMDVKAITYHQLVVKEDIEGGLVRVFLDI